MFSASCVILDVSATFVLQRRNGVCIEVLLSYAQGEYDVLREANAKGETPLDIATAIGDTSLVLRSGSAAGGRGRACPGDGVDMQRIMAVWERFFENAAVACVGGRDTSRDTRGPSRNQHRQLGAGHHQTTAKRLEPDGWVACGDHPAMALEFAEEIETVTTARGNGVRAGAENTVRSGDKEKSWNGGEADVASLAPGERNRQLSRLLQQPGTTTTERARVCAWDAAPINPAGGHHEGKPFYSRTRHQPAPQQPTIEDEPHVQLERDAPVLSSDDVDLHLFQTPRGDSSVTEVVWLSGSHQGEIRSVTTSKPAADAESFPVATTAAGGLFQRHHTWVACWDAASESIYYWDSESGQSTWDAPASADGVHELQSCVWDPQREAFFTIDDGGTSRWLTGSSLEGRQTIDDLTSLDTAVPSAQAAEFARVNSGSTGSTTRLLWHRLEPNAGAAVGSPSAGAAGFRGNDHANSAEGAAEQSAAGSAMLQARTQYEEQDLRLSPYPLAEAGYQPVEQLPDSLGEYDYPGEQSCSGGMPSFAAQKDAGRHHDQVELTAEREEQPRSTNTAAASSTNDESAGVDDKSDDAEFFDSRTFEDHGPLLSAWVLWCTAPSRQSGDEPPYFVNEETGTSSWVLPPEAVATSGGWLRAWSEQHQAWFFANQWTGRATWELQSL